MRLAPCAQVQVLPHALPGATELTLAFFRRRCAWFDSPKELNQDGRAPQVSMRKLSGAYSIRVEGACCRLDYLSLGNPRTDHAAPFQQ